MNLKEFKKCLSERAQTSKRLFYLIMGLNCNTVIDSSILIHVLQRVKLGRLQSVVKGVKRMKRDSILLTTNYGLQRLSNMIRCAKKNDFYLRWMGLNPESIGLFWDTIEILIKERYKEINLKYFDRYVTQILTEIWINNIQPSVAFDMLVKKSLEKSEKPIERNYGINMRNVARSYSW
jgi:hypothetical protein